MNVPDHGRRRSTAMLVALGLLAGLGVAAVATTPTAQPAAAAVGECPEGTLPGPGSANPIWTDQNVAVYAGADFQTREQAAEAEGVVVVAGNASFDRSTTGRFNVGWVGVGSGVAPFPGTTMLAVGGDLSVGSLSILDVGANAISEGELLGGDVQIGGVSSPDYALDGSRYELNNGTLTEAMGPAAIAQWAGWGTLISQQSADLAALSPTGTVTPGALLTFAGDGAAAQQVFTVAAATLNANPAVNFTGIPDGATVVVNVTGGPVTWAPNYFADDGVRADDFASPLFGVLASRTLWNFPDATSVHLAGSSQVLGTILVPGANPDPALPTLHVTASTNGRLFTNGTVLMDGVGNEHHNYPWLTAPFECIPVTGPNAVGSVTVEKILSPDDAALLPDGTTFHGIISCPVAGGGELTVEWEVAPGDVTTVGSLPVGTTCEITESIGPQARLRLAPPGMDLDVTRLSAWEAPAWTVNGAPATAPVQFIVPAPEDEVQFAFTVENALQTGLFTITKAVVNPDEVEFDDGFTGSWACYESAAVDAEIVLSGSWSLAAGETSAPIPAPVGSWCAVTETAPADPVGGLWADPVVTPGRTLITAGSAQTPLVFSVTNTLAESLGAFTVEKVVTGDAAPAATFTGRWSCELPAGTIVAEGVWTLVAGETTAPIEAPVGAVCTVTEDEPAATDDGLWAPPAITGSPLEVSAGEGDPALVVVTNVFTETGGRDDGEGGGDGGEVDGDLPATGGGVPAWIVWVGVGLLAAGAAVVVAGMVRRRRP